MKKLIKSVVMITISSFILLYGCKSDSGDSAAEAVTNGNYLTGSVATTDGKYDYYLLPNFKDKKIDIIREYDGNKKTVKSFDFLPEDLMCLEFSDGNLYYSSYGGIFKIKPDGSNEKKEELSGPGTILSVKPSESIFYAAPKSIYYKVDFGKGIREEYSLLCTKPFIDNDTIYYVGPKGFGCCYYGIKGDQIEEYDFVDNRILNVVNCNGGMYGIYNDGLTKINISTNTENELVEFNESVLSLTYDENCFYVSLRNRDSKYHCTIVKYDIETGATEQLCKLENPPTKISICNEWLYIYNTDSLIGDRYYNRVKTDGSVMEELLSY